MRNLINIATMMMLVFCVNLGMALAEEGTGQGNTKAKAEQVELININTADVNQLQVLPRVGPVIAERIVAFRQEHGSFKSAEELMNVKGIGPKTFDRLKPLITVGQTQSKE